jgi:hypothetical protein
MSEIKSVLIATKSELREEQDIPYTIRHHVLIGNGTTSETNDLTTILLSLLSLLKESQDVFLNKLPLGLPPLQGIEHHIDLMQGATLPKCTAHRTKPDDQEEMQRQTHDCQAHGYVHENLSPRVVPTIFVMHLGCSLVSSLFCVLCNIS